MVRQELGTSGRERGATASSITDDSMASQYHYVPCPYLGPTPFIPFCVEGSLWNKEFAPAGKLSFAGPPSEEEKYLNRSYPARKYNKNTSSVRVESGWGCNCPVPAHSGCTGERPCPNWIQQCFKCRVAIQSHAARSQSRVETDCQDDPRKMMKELLAYRVYGYTCIFIDDEGESGYYTKAKGHWKPVCFQCAYLWEHGKVVKLNKQLQDTAIQSGEFQHLTRELKNVTEELKTTEDTQEELEKSVTSLKNDKVSLQKDNNRLETELSLEKSPKEEAFTNTRLWTKESQSHEAKTYAAHREVDEFRHANETSMRPRRT